MSFQEQDVDEILDAPDQEMLHDFLRLFARTTIIIGHCILYYSALVPIVALLSTFQEYKIWKTTPTPMTPYGFFKCFCFNFVWMALCLLGSLAFLPIWALRGFGKSIEKEAFCVVETLTAMAITKGFLGSVVIVGAENLPEVSLDGYVGGGPAPVFVANHSSQLDCTVTYYAIRRFKWVAKESVRFIPGPGNLMSLSGHVFIKRKGKNAESNNNLFETSNEAIQSGIPIFIFPQGTRRMSEKLPFKAGAFKIAIENQTQVVPMSIHVPLGVWNSLYPFNLLWGTHLSDENKITLTVHEPIQTTNTTVLDELKKKCYDVIYSALPPLHAGGNINNISTDEKMTNKKTN